MRAQETEIERSEGIKENFGSYLCCFHAALSVAVDVFLDATLLLLLSLQTKEAALLKLLPNQKYN